MPAAFVPHRCGILMVILCMSVFILGFGSYNFIYLPQILPQIGVPLGVIIALGVLFNSVWFLAVWSYFSARWTHPGTIPERWTEFAEDYRLAIGPSKQEWQPAQATRCSKCLGVRPERTHHCSVSNMCVLRMDHYCPWTATCIGFHNHKFFLLLATYNFLSVLVFFLSTVPTVFYTVQNWLLEETDTLRAAQGGLFLFCVVVSAASCYLLGEMVYVHASRMFVNVTSIEESYSNIRNPYNLGKRWLNVAQVFGTFGLDWFLPIPPRRPTSDGVSFLRQGEHWSGTGSGSDSESGDVATLGDDGLTCEEVWHKRYVLHSHLPMEAKAPTDDSDNCSDSTVG